MKLRPPAIPLITVDPYFSVWSPTEKLYDSETMHWTGKHNALRGTVTVDGEVFRFMGLGEEPTLTQTDFTYNALSTYYTFRGKKIELKLCFTTPLLPDDLSLLSRPVSYLRLSASSLDGKKHDVSVTITASEQLCLDHAGQSDVVCADVDLPDMACICMGNADQKVLNRSGDDVRIDWGCFYLAACGEDAETLSFHDDMSRIGITVSLSHEEALVLFAYDDIKSLNYFGKPISSVWNHEGKTIEEALSEALYGYEETYLACEQFSEGLFLDGVRAGGKKYAEMLELAYRQAFAAHKLGVTEEGELLFASKECFSNGCAATVDVSYPSVPLFLIYNPELVRGMMRPIYRFAQSDAWKFDFAPHDAGTYPLLTGQVYGLDREKNEYIHAMQMPVEECGNMLIMEAACALADGNIDFSAEHADILETWVKYLVRYGYDPENQLCTDDFAGHLAHNCNLSLKAVMGIASYAILQKLAGKKQKYNEYMSEARKMAASWCKRAANGDGSYRLAFDRPGTFSMKYNAVWDKVFGTGIFPPEVMQSELFSNFRHFNPYGMPLDNRSDYTKADWIVWTATMLEDDDDFERYVEPLWKAYHHTTSRVPMTDWYFTTTAIHQHFVHRSVIGGLFMKMLDHLGTCACGERLP